eukprot:CAMPEP_0118853452 /NCGR_PEP_ID=MMETSP1163-20130328/2034_1 /TAXON_ID=124430 /ORGANISM="Phaeomonas parva, Strain CCMP2877" /LENGTH=30 /DNA_ID= /DNA_START= /DNA_END= /DNA_ORIENTATION=
MKYEARKAHAPNGRANEAAHEARHDGHDGA